MRWPVSMRAQLYGFDKLADTAAAKGPKKGRILSIGKEEVFVDFGGKSQGVVPILQFEELPKIGEEMEFHIERYDAREGILLLSRKGVVTSDVNWDHLEVGQVLEATVTGVNKGGLELEVKSLRAFMPSGQVDIYHVPDLNQFIGQKITGEIIEVQRESKNLLLSRRNILERERQARARSCGWKLPRDKSDAALSDR